MGFRFNGVTDNEEIVKILMDAGMTKPQAQSAAARKVVEIFAEDNQIAIQVLSKMVDGLCMEVGNCEVDVKRSLRRAEETGKKAEELIQTINSFHNIAGELTDERAKNGFALYAAIIQLSMNQKEISVEMAEQIFENAGYALYAYFGGQARRIFHFAGSSRRNSERGDVPMIKDGRVNRSEKVIRV